MRARFGWSLVLVAALAACAAGVAFADVKTQERTQIKFEGMLGRMMGMFGGKAAKEGLVSTVAVQGDRKMTVTGDTGELIDLAGEKVYTLDMKKKTYKVATFAELREQMRKAQEEAKKNARQPQEQEQAPGQPEREMEVDFDLKETGQKRAIAGHECREMVMTVTVREKGKTLEQNGGIVMVSNMWLAPRVAALQESMDFDRRYAQKLYGDLVSVEAMQQMAAAMAMYPGMKDAMDRMSKENVKMDGSPLLTTMAFQVVKSEQQAAQEKEQESSSGGGGLMGGLARRMMKKKEAPEASGGAANRATIMTSTTEVLSIATDVSAADVNVPAGFKETK
jgi:hypothetical protein